MKTAWMFPGQGTQTPGMGQRLLLEFPSSREVMRLAESLAGLPLERLRLQGPAEALQDPSIAEPLIATIQIAYANQLLALNIRPDFVAGYSAGEVAAYYVAGILSLEDALQAAIIRGSVLRRYTSDATVMMVVTRLDKTRIEEVLTEVRNEVEFAAFNAPQHFTLVGTVESVRRVAKACKQKGGHCSDVAVAGPWHSRKLVGAAEEIEAKLEVVTFHPPQIPIATSAYGELNSEPTELRRHLAAQVALPIQWQRIVTDWWQASVQQFIEMGPGRVLQGIMRYCLPANVNYQVSCVESATGSIQAYKRLFHQPNQGTKV